MKWAVSLFAIGILCRAQPLTFEVASVRLAAGGERQMIRPEPGRLSITNLTLRALVRYAYDVRDIQVSGGPGWFDSDHWDVIATAGREVSDLERKKMLQTLLSERFQMTIRHDTKELPVYALVVGKNAPKLKPSPEASPQRIMLEAKGGLLTMIGEHVTLPRIADVLFGQVGRIVLDRTGIEGAFDYKLEWVPDRANMPSLNGARMEPSMDGPSIFTAVQEQLGLKLESSKAPVEILVIERAEKATEN